MALASGGYTRPVGGTNYGSALSSARPTVNLSGGPSGGGMGGTGGVSSLIDALDETKKRKTNGTVGVSEGGNMPLDPNQQYYGPGVTVNETTSSSGAYSRPFTSSQGVNQVQGLGNQAIGGLGQAIEGANIAGAGPAAPTPYTFDQNAYKGFNPGQNVQTLYRGSGGSYGAGGFDTTGTAIKPRGLGGAQMLQNSGQTSLDDVMNVLNGGGV